MNKLRQLAELGQSVWLDRVRRCFLSSGEMQGLLDDGLGGAIFNPSVFQQTVVGGTDYDQALRELAIEGKRVEEIREALILEEVRRAADLLQPIYDRTGGSDGYVSLGVNPDLARDVDGMVLEARRLFTEAGRANVMISLPGTREGLASAETLLSAGINVNVTSIYSPEGCAAAAAACISGLEQRAMDGEDVSKIASAVSFAVTPLDAAIDEALEVVGTSQALDLRGKIGIAAARVAYDRSRELFEGERWARLARLGAHVQRVLWSEVVPQNLTFPDTLYVDELIAPHTVYVMPSRLVDVFRDRGTPAPTLEAGLEEARLLLAYLARLDIDLRTVAATLREESIAEASRVYTSSLDSLAEKRDRLLVGWRPCAVALGPCRDAVGAGVAKMIEREIVPRIWAHDHTVWKPDSTEIADRLGWLHVAEVMRGNISRMKGLLQGVRRAGYTRALLLGMGGSSRAAEMFRQVFGVGDEGLNLAVLDSTDPQAVRAWTERLDPAQTLFIVASKSGTTVETLSLFKLFYDWTADALGAERAGEHFVAITDPGTPLDDRARELGFRGPGSAPGAYLNDPYIGGRYSALSYFGLLPAVLQGVDVERLLDAALAMMRGCAPWVPSQDHPALWLGAALGALAQSGRDKVTFVASPNLVPFGDWVEQLIAESTGKEGVGIVPVVGEPLGPPEVYGDDRFFVHLRLSADGTWVESLARLEAAGHPVLHLNLRERYDLGGQIFLWELAVAVAAHLLRVNPFNQPNVESAKERARHMLAEYERVGTLPRGEYAPVTAESLDEFLAQAWPGDYVALQAYLPPTVQIHAVLLGLRARLRDRLRLATMADYGPRYLHASGQLHKGDAGSGLFVQFTADHPQDLAIPGEAADGAVTFGLLERAQALGDRRALLDAGRRVIHFHLGEDVVGGLERLRSAGWTFRRNLTDVEPDA